MFMQTKITDTSNSKQSHTKHWDYYYSNNLAPKPPSDFAKFAMDYMHPQKMLIDLGCGNGRDSAYFCKCGLKVTAIDLSKGAIASFDKAMPIFAVCDDFVTTKALACVEYDYCYARWSIHAINQAQQDELIPNVYFSLKKDGWDMRWRHTEAALYKQRRSPCEV